MNTHSPILDSRLRYLFSISAADLLNYFARRVAAKEDAADLLSETFIVAWRRVESIPANEEESRMWLFGVARRVLSNWNRADRRRAALFQKLAMTQKTTSHDEDVLDDVISMRSAVAGLPRAQRELVMLIHWEGFRLAEAASILGVSVSTARGRYQRARLRLRKDFNSRLNALPIHKEPQAVHSPPRFSSEHPTPK
jgi:RNA polymerase sigma-70 factor (ECF subfamily)